MIERKILEKEQLAKVIQVLKREGKEVAQCHGCFDLLHVGHMKYLKKAKELVDVLVVTVTPDRFIFKGPGRPVFNEQLRLEALTHLEYVNYVCLNDRPDAVEIIKLLKPNYYVKGDEYKDFSSDVTGKIKLEKEAVESVGGKLVFTQDPTFSSSKLINENFSVLPRQLRDYFARIRKLFTYETIEEYIDKISCLKVLIIGEIIIDEYCYCQVAGTVTKFPIVSAIYQSSEKMTGGSLAAARHMSSFVNKVHLISTIGADRSYEDVIDEVLKQQNVSADLFSNDDTTTIVKRRYIARGYPNPLTNVKRNDGDDVGTRLFEVGYLNRDSIPAALEANILKRIQQIKNDFDIIIISDFGHGLITRRIRQQIRSSGLWWAVNTQTNSTNFGFNLITKYQDPDLICLDELEARLPFGDRVTPLKYLSATLKRRTRCRNLMITRGKSGQWLFAGDSFSEAPAFATKVVDPVGAGDAVLSITPLCIYSKFEPELTLFLSGCFGAIAANIFGNRNSVQKPILMKYIEGIMK